MVKKKIKKQIIILLTMVSVFSSSLTAFANEIPSDTVSNLIGDNYESQNDAKGSSVKESNYKNNTASLSISMNEDNEEYEEYRKSNPEIEYAYDGPDFIYAKIEYDNNTYTIMRSEYGTFLKELQNIGTPEEYFVPTVAIIVDEEAEAKKKESMWQKDTSNPFAEWTGEQWDAYSEFAQTFYPDEWQKTLLEYYTLPEIYAYYMGLGYYIDEWALKNKIEYEAAHKEVDEVATKQVEELYKTITIKYDLDSMYNKELKYCIAYASLSDFEILLTNYDLFNEEKANILDPNTYKNDEYNFEAGTLDRYVTTYESVSKDDAKAIVSYIQKKQVLENSIPENADPSDYYKIRVRTKNGTKLIEKVYIIPSNAFLELVSKYFSKYSNDLSSKNAVSVSYIQDFFDDAKG